MKTKIIKNAFTLVELIVVIVILSILATISFLSFQNYSGQARDSNRMADINGISKGIELYFVKTGVYPVPDNSFTITYSGGGVWYQGTIGDNLVRKLGNLSKKAIDPLTGNEYIYSTLVYGSSYQIKANYEGDSISYNDTIENSSSYNDTMYNNQNIFNTPDKVSATTGNPKIAYIKGNYMGVVVKTTTGSTICILATPSIITNTGSSGNSYEIGNNSLSGTLLYHGQSNTNGIYYNPNKPIYCNTSLPTNDTNSGLTNIASGIINAYSGSIVASLNTSVQTIVNTPISSLSSLGASIVSGQLGGSVSGGGGGGNIAVATNGLSSSTPGTTCYSIKTSYPSSTDGVYWIKPDSNPAFQVYCDMTNDGGGWTFIVGINGGDQNQNTASSVSTGNLLSPSGKGKYSDTIINTIRTAQGSEGIVRFTCSNTDYFDYRTIVWHATYSSSPNGTGWDTYTQPWGVAPYSNGGAGNNNQPGPRSYIGRGQLMIYGYSSQNGCYYNGGSWGNPGTVWIR